MHSLSIIIPAYNEEKRIGRTLKAYSDFLEGKRLTDKIRYMLLIVINNTTDNTKSVVEAYKKKNRRIEYIDINPKGKGGAIIEGFNIALKKGYEVVGFVDADMATSPEEYWKLFLAMGKHDGAIADRYMKGAVIKPRPTIRRLVAKRMFNFVARVFLFIPFRDTQCGAKIFKRKALEKLAGKLSMSQWAFDVELLYHLRKEGLKVVPVPTFWEDKAYSTINFWSSGPWMVIAIMRLRLINSAFRDFVRFYDKFIGFIPR